MGEVGFESENMVSMLNYHLHGHKIEIVKHWITEQRFSHFCLLLLYSPHYYKTLIHPSDFKSAVMPCIHQRLAVTLQTTQHPAPQNGFLTPSS